MKKIIPVVLLLLVLVGLGFFLKNNRSSTLSKPESNQKIKISTSFYPLYFFATSVGGSKVEVKNITPAGSEPHDYEPTAQDLAFIENSRLLILNGGVEAWANKIKDNLKGKNTTILVAGDGLLTRQLTEDGQTAIDPHIWLSPQLAKIEAKKVADALISVDQSNSIYYQDNEKQLEMNLDELDSSYKQGLSNCQHKDIITSHAAFGYLAAGYGLNQMPIAGLSPDAEPSAKQLTEISQFARDHNIKYIFFESLVSPKLSETIANEIGAQTLVLDPLEGLSDDDITKGKDYFSVMKDNLKNLQIALQCS